MKARCALCSCPLQEECATQRTRCTVLQVSLCCSCLRQLGSCFGHHQALKLRKRFWPHLQVVAQEDRRRLLQTWGKGRQSADSKGV